MPGPLDHWNAWLSRRRHERLLGDVPAALEQAFEDAELSEPAEAHELRLIVLSDQHRGARDGADDFLRCERAYNAALAHYLEHGFTLHALGDVEELWECAPAELDGKYPETLELEGEFHARGRLRRFWGNHDLLWSEPGQFRKHLGREFFPGLTPIEALRIPLLCDGRPLGELLLAHGHQGTLHWVGLHKLILRFGWRGLQNRLNVASTSPAFDWDVRGAYDRTLAGWASREPGRVLITGHSHRPVFWGDVATARVDGRPVGPADVARLEAGLETARDSGSDAALARARAELEYLRAELRRHEAQRGTPLERPSYFNSGCCSYGDGKITGIQIDDGWIRLVRWTNDRGERKPEILAERTLSDVFAALDARSG